MVMYLKGRFRAEEVSVRIIGSIQIVFWDKETIYVIDNNRSMRYIFHRWFAPRKSYDDWRHFRDLLWKTKNPNIGYYFEKSALYGIQFTTTTRPLDFGDRKVKYL